MNDIFLMSQWTSLDEQWTSLDGHSNQTIQTMINQVNTPSLQTILSDQISEFSVTPRHLERFSIECLN